MKISKLKQMFSDTKNIKKNSKIASFLEDEVTGILRKEESFTKNHYSNKYNPQNTHQNQHYIHENQKSYNNFPKESQQNTTHNPLPRNTNNPSYFNPHDDENYNSRSLNTNNHSFNNSHNNNSHNNFSKRNYTEQQDLLLEENSLRILKPIIEGWLEENLESLAEKIIRKELKKYLETEDEDKYIREKNYQFDFQEIENNKNEEDYLRDKFLKETRERIRYKYEK